MWGLYDWCMSVNRSNPYLQVPTQPLGVGDKSIGELLGEMARTGFQGRKLGEAVEVWNRMLDEEGLVIFMGLSGAMVPAGMRRVIAYLIRNHFIDCLVSTGANIFHDCHEALGQRHYIGSHLVDDAALFEQGVDRIYDVFALEEEFRGVDDFIAGFVEGLDDERSYSSREFIELLGREVARRSRDRDSIVISACEEGVPVFVPALCDSSIGIGLLLARRRGGRCVQIDHIADVDEITRLVETSEKTGVVFVGGGVPKNFIQQTEVAASLCGHESGGHDYALQFTTDSPQWGGLSGCTFDEAMSWGKISIGARRVQVFSDATIALPLVVHGLHERRRGMVRERRGMPWD